VLQLYDDVNRHAIAPQLARAYFDYYGYKPSDEEVAAWNNSIAAVAGVMEDAALEDNAIAIEYQLPMTSRRIDCMVTGKDDLGVRNALIIELKQWEDCQPCDSENEVLTWVGGTHREVLHPSVQVLQYRDYLQDMNTAFYEDDPVALAACAFLHNYIPHADDPLFDAKFADMLSEAPSFTAASTEQLENLLHDNVGAGDGVDVLSRIDHGKYRPSKKLLEHVANMINGKPEYVLLDEQRVVYDKVMSVARTAIAAGQKAAIVVRGGPGTGKSVLAINLMADLAREDVAVEYATGSRAFTTTLRKILGRRGSALFKYFNSYSDAQENQLGVLICDEAHRIRENSNSMYTPRGRRSGRLQIDELLGAAHVGVYFIDDDQVVRPQEIGSSSLILERAHALHIPAYEYHLEAQFRCSGSDAFVAWVENTLQIRRTANVLWNATEESFDFRIMDTPQQVENEIMSRVASGYSGRMTAGFCWPWSKALDEKGNLVSDVQLNDYEYARPWNAPPTMSHLPPKVPPADLWAYSPGGINEVGCVYTAQGFEFDYVGVIFGQDLVYRFATQTWQGQPDFCFDTVVKRGGDRLVELLKHSYRVLLTRGLKGCYVFFVDKETRDYWRSRME